MIFSLWVFPLIFGWAYRKIDKQSYGPTKEETAK
jgi:cobalt-zinc-cadmium resistance protein CzcA